MRATFTNIDHKAGATAADSPVLRTADTGIDVTELTSRLTQSLEEIVRAIKEIDVSTKVDIPTIEIPAAQVTVQPAVVNVPATVVNLPESPTAVTVHAHYPVKPLIIISLSNMVVLLAILSFLLIYR